MFNPFARPLYVMLKPIGADCNLACDYCYYQEKSKLHGHGKMSDELLEIFTRQYIEAQTMPQVLFTWHGGEPLMRPINFYQKALNLQKKYAHGRVVDNCIQTNGTLLTDEWCQFFKENNWLVGISIDGPEEMHNAYRKDKNEKPSFKQVMQGIEMLDKHQVAWNAMAVINNLTAEAPLEFYHFFKQIGCHYLQFTPVVERLKDKEDTNGCLLAHSQETSPCRLAPYSITPEQWGTFLCTLFDEWVHNDIGEYFIQLFDATLANWVGEAPGICALSPTCGHSAVMEWNGDVYSCDHFVFPEYRLGNIRSQSIVEMLYGEKQACFGESKHRNLPHQCKQCPYLFTCHGECPRNRFCLSNDGEPGLNYLCKGYHHFFTHVTPYMDYMKQLLNNGLPPSLLMDALK